MLNEVLTPLQTKRTPVYEGNRVKIAVIDSGIEEHYLRDPNITYMNFIQKWNPAY